MDACCPSSLSSSSAGVREKSESIKRFCSGWLNSDRNPGAQVEAQSSAVIVDEKSTITVGVSFEGIPVLSETADLCSSLSGNTTGCPVPPGVPFALQVAQELPGFAPPDDNYGIAVLGSSSNGTRSILVLPAYAPIETPAAKFS